MAKRKISVDEFVKDVTSGQGDSELMEKYRLSRKQLDAMFTKLLERGELRPADLVADQTVPVWAATQELAAVCPICGTSKVFEQAPCPKCGHSGEHAEPGKPTGQPRPTPLEQATASVPPESGDPEPEPSEPEDPWDVEITLPPSPTGPAFQEEADIELDLGPELDTEDEAAATSSEPPAPPQAWRGGKRAILLSAASLAAVVIIALGMGFYLDLIPFPGEPTPPPPAPRPAVASAKKPQPSPRPQVATAQKPQEPAETPDGLKRSPGVLSPETEPKATARVAPEASAPAPSGVEPSGSTKLDAPSEEPEKVAVREEGVGPAPEKAKDVASAPSAPTPLPDESRFPSRPEQPPAKQPDRAPAAVAATESSTPVRSEPAATSPASDQPRAQKEAEALQQPANELIEAVKHGDVQTIDRLLQSGVDPNTCDKEGVTALIHAAAEGRDAAASVLLKYGANPNLKDGRGETALLLAREKGHEKIVALLAGYEKEKGAGALLEAAKNGRLDLVQAQVQSGANLNATDEDGNTALMLAAEMGHLEVVDLLLESGADTNVRNKNGATALSRAYSPGATKAYVPLKVRRDIVRVLKEHGRGGIGSLERH